MVRVCGPGRVRAVGRRAGGEGSMESGGGAVEPVRIEVASDPFIRKWLQSGVYLTGAAWTAEAFRRATAHYQPVLFPYYVDEPTWYWSRVILEDVLDCEGDVSRSRFDLDGPGVGVHVFESPETPASLAAFRQAGKIRGFAIDEGDRVAYTYLLRVAPDGACTGASPRNPGELMGRAPLRYPEHPVYSRLAVKLQAVLRAKAVEFTPRQAPRHLRRQAKRGLGLDMETAVRVVRWRKPAPGDRKEGGAGEGATRGFHRCRGHFREQWYPSKQRHGAFFIEAHYRGSGPVKGGKLPVVHYVKR